ncbi:hypothetical protein SUGI_0173710 [Cryptomeria japonica]|uniref:uncharacterized protein LOC131078925 n=1 Tax=Cryptomeria japonica TaxID=3369 RepID=UPI002408CB44|nr:uncharacterized protein LOC131078925 [Cryptomeria japonica]XP_057872752.1 uncharacterized protein LOC131078925 [Cryptomeria japonica]XP_057872753.1 uncharacterized protein LOC131078925 [Cryptomeria japonica]GLJ11657.1 hypothetical protein SUGI_0173710 [Cryptomeria japonica]
MQGHERLLATPRINRSIRKWRQNRSSTIAIVAIALALATFTWLSVVFSPARSHLQEWQGSPLAFPWEPFGHDEEEEAQDQDSGSMAITGNMTGAFMHSTDRSKRSFKAGNLSLDQVVFGIGGSAQYWDKRKEFVKLWFEPQRMRGFVWLEEPVKPDPLDALPPVKLSDDISRFAYTNPKGHPSGVRIARVVQETFRLGLQNVHWFVLGDDDTVFNVHNLIRVLSKYDPSEMHYIGSPSESHSANAYFSQNMAFGGGGIAISYPLAEVLSNMEDACLERYAELYGSDDRLHACISELGIPLTREPGFHQWDVRGNAFGLLAGHPVAPFVSMHHLEAVDPVFPQHNSLDGLKLLVKAMKTEPTSFLQRSICYDHKRRLSFSVSNGYVVQVFPKIILPRELDRVERTFKAWNRRDRADDFDIDTRAPYKSICSKPFLFFLKDVHNVGGSKIVSYYKRDNVSNNLNRRAFCLSSALPVHETQEIEVVSRPMPSQWHLLPRRQCCKLKETKNKVLGLTVGPCAQGKSRYIL